MPNTIIDVSKNLDIRHMQLLHMHTHGDRKEASKSQKTKCYTDNVLNKAYLKLAASLKSFHRLGILKIREQTKFLRRALC